MFNLSFRPFRMTQMRRAFSILSEADRKKVIAVALLQVMMGALDLLGVALIGVLGALAVNGIKSQEPGNRVARVLEIMNLDSLSFQSQAVTIGCLAASVLVLKTLASVFLTRKILFFLSRRGAVVSTELISRLLNQPLLNLQVRTTQSSLYAVTSGVTNITLGVVGTAVSLIADVSLLLVMAVGLTLVNPLISFCMLTLFGSIGLLLYLLLKKRASELGTLDAKLNIDSNEKIIEVLGAYREAVIRDRRQHYAQEIGKIRLRLADTLAESSFMPNISKYVVEASVIIGAITISAIQFLIADAAHAIGTLSIFLAAGTRIAPAVLRVQQGAITIKGALGASEITLNLIEALPPLKATRVRDEVDFEHFGFISSIEMQDVSFKYPGESTFSLSNLSLTISPGQKIAIVGPSGAGKSTLVDLMLGVIQPLSGKITISGLPPDEAVSKWPGSIGYVPQDSMITTGTIKENVGLGFNSEQINETWVSRALKMAHLESFVQELPEGMNAIVGERGAGISGGQRQRLGIARSLFTNPKILILDEATSALDGQTELEISQAIQELKGTTTLVLIAHRLSTVRDADLVVYMENGRIIELGSFEEVRSQIPNFDIQARLMGL
jgi:ABC-type multidrug transport system fused ATPase/permease subunit